MRPYLPMTRKFRLTVVHFYRISPHWYRYTRAVQNSKPSRSMSLTFLPTTNHIHSPALTLIPSNASIHTSTPTPLFLLLACFDTLPSISNHDQARSPFSVSHSHIPGRPQLQNTKMDLIMLQLSRFRPSHVHPHQTKMAGWYGKLTLESTVCICSSHLDLGMGMWRFVCSQSTK